MSHQLYPQQLQRGRLPMRRGAPSRTQLTATCSYSPLQASAAHAAVGYEPATTSEALDTSERTAASAVGASTSAAAAATVDAPANGLLSIAEPVGNKESMRRKRIGEANKGREPWNKGKKHSPETIAKIRERTRAAMKRPDVVAKLKVMPHPRLSDATKAKISASLKARYATMERPVREGAASKGRPPRPKKQVPLKLLSPEEEAARAQEEELKKALRKERLSSAMKAKWQDPEYRAMMHKSMTSPSTQAKRVSTSAQRARKTRENLQAARQVLDIQSERVAAALAERKAVISKAQRAVADCEAAVADLEGKKAAFANDDVMRHRAEAALTTAYKMLGTFRTQLEMAKAAPLVVPGTAAKGPPLNGNGASSSSSSSSNGHVNGYGNGSSNGHTNGHAVHVNGVATSSSSSSNGVTNGTAAAEFASTDEQRPAMPAPWDPDAAAAAAPPTGINGNSVNGRSANSAGDDGYPGGAAAGLRPQAPQQQQQQQPPPGGPAPKGQPTTRAPPQPSVPAAGAAATGGPRLPFPAGAASRGQGAGTGVQTAAAPGAGRLPYPAGAGSRGQPAGTGVHPAGVGVQVAARRALTGRPLKDDGNSSSASGSGSVVRGSRTARSRSLGTVPRGGLEA